VSVPLVDVVPDREASRNVAAVGGGVVQTRLGPREQLGLFEHPAGVHTLALAVQHERAEPVRQVMVGEELQVELVELK